MSPFGRRRAARQDAPRPVHTELVADDDAVVRDVLESALAASGYHVVAVADGQAALEAAEAHSPDAAVLDWLMPHVYGPDVCAALRRRPQSADIPVLLLTTQGEERDVSHAFATGADDYVTKPFHPREVVAALDRLLAEREALRADAAGESEQGAT